VHHLFYGLVIMVLSAHILIWSYAKTWEVRFVQHIDYCYVSPES